jgi:RAB protein geranylgeranyltransferase component A
MVDIKEKLEYFNSYKIPKIPEGIIQSVNNKNLAIFIGAGVSRLLGCKGWNDLANNLLDLCVKNNYIEKKERDVILQEDNKKKITISYNIFKKK